MQFITLIRATAEHLAWLFVTIIESWELLNAQDATTFQLFRLKFDFNSENDVKLSHIVNQNGIILAVYFSQIISNQTESY